jgi:hypothetical protein
MLTAEIGTNRAFSHVQQFRQESRAKLTCQLAILADQWSKAHAETSGGACLDPSDAAPTSGAIKLNDFLCKSSSRTKSPFTERYSVQSYCRHGNTIRGQKVVRQAPGKHFEKIHGETYRNKVKR